jgi:hypothetical protein
MIMALFALFYLGGAYFIIYAFWKELNRYGPKQHSKTTNKKTS